VHHLVAEAVLLVRRSVGAGAAAIAVHVAGDVARIAITADAPFAVGPAAQPTLASIAERADDLGGTLEVPADGRGIRVEVPR
jgi:hypothetical protein